MVESVSYGTRIASIIKLPEKAAKVWLKELGEDERLKEREYVNTDKLAWINGEHHYLVIYRSSDSYHLAINPEED